MFRPLVSTLVERHPALGEPIMANSRALLKGRCEERPQQPLPLDLSILLAKGAWAAQAILVKRLVKPAASETAPTSEDSALDMLQAVILGIVQGLTEFLPISSSAHLRIVPALVGWDDPGAAFTAVIQIGTLAAVLAYFRRDIVRIARAWTRGVIAGRPLGDLDARLGWMIIAGTVPIVVCGLAFKHEIETTLRSLYVVATALVSLAVLLAVAEVIVHRRVRARQRLRDLSEITWTDALAIGAAQALALVPGSSRSGVTITAGLFAGMSRETAARFSFLLSLPSVFAAGAYELYGARNELLGSRQDVAALVVATVAALLSGYATIAFLLYYLRTHTTYVFVVYRLLLGGLIYYLLAAGWLNP
jgi:undecaprenyl-diphosphatase